MTTVYESNRFAFQVSWGSILAGSAVALVTYLIFSVLGTAVGARAVDMMQKGNPLSGFGTGTGIWLLVSTLASLAAGAFVAGRTAPNRGGLHGLLSWAITTLLTTRWWFHWRVAWWGWRVARWAKGFRWRAAAGGGSAKRGRRPQATAG